MCIAGIRTLIVIASLLLSVPGFAQTNADNYPESRTEADIQSARKSMAVDVSDIKPGHVKTVTFLGRPIWIYRRTRGDLAYLHAGSKEDLANPDGKDMDSIIQDVYQSSRDEVWLRLFMLSEPRFEKAKYRSATEEYLVMVGNTPLGCVANIMPIELRPHASSPFMCPCSGLWFDVAGRVLKNNWTPPRVRTKALARANIMIPPHYFSSPSTLVIGLRPSEKLPEVDLARIRKQVYARLSLIEKLAYAANYNDLDEVRRCLKAGALTQRRPWPINPLDGAIAGGSTEIVKRLLANGASPTKNTFEIAKSVNRTEIIPLLKQYKHHFTDACDLVNTCFK